jgi:hypothetical protein
MAKRPRDPDLDRLLDDNAEPYIIEMDKPGPDWSPVRYAPMHYQAISRSFWKQTLTSKSIEAFVTETVMDPSFIACELAVC